MPKFTYHLQLKGYVGGEDFNRKDVDDTLAAHPDEEVHVLIDSTGGSLATGMSISASFRQHGNVHVHLVGLNASAATIASLGAKRVTIDSGAMYLIHQCSLDFFKWAALNSDQYRQMIADCQRTADELDKLDENCARLYARKCNKQPEDILALMKLGGWISPKEAKDWGFVDEITDNPEDVAACMTDALASAMAVEGMPIPNIPIAAATPDSIISRIVGAITSFFKSTTTSDHSFTQKIMNKTYSLICAIIGASAIALTDDRASVTAQQLDSIEAALADKDKTINDHQATIAARDARIAELEAALAAKPADTTANVVDTGKEGSNDSDKSDVEAFVDSYNNARNLYNLV